ncbi:two-component system sensor histidine kinase NtrB [Alkalihalobacterium elongatum]|uniref:two-component system sensor histidine kinase NtrB n=1 Tax=Alkalihalobacterium elongatum TaxID=2675466 RepID=UPI001C1F2D0C|nr:ATP-binding protein [Alkalihalobacterium elongatum]
MLRKGLDNSNIQRILEALPFGVLIVDAKGSFIFINSTVYEIWGLDPSDLTIHSVYGDYEGYYKNTGQKISGQDWAIIRAIEKGETSFGEVIGIQTFDGRNATILNSAIPLFNDDGSIAGAVLTISDITEAKQLDIELNIHKRYLSKLVESKTKELQEKNEKLKKEIVENERLQKKKRQMDQLHLVGEMAVGFGHEIRNRMTTVKMLLQLLYETDLPDPEKKQLISTALSDVENANDIISEFITLSHNKKVELHPNNLNEIVTEALKLLQSEQDINIDRFNIEFINPLPTIYADKEEIKLLIINLMKNGFEAMEDHQVLTVQTQIKGNDILLIIKDEGSGINQTILDKISTPFFSTKDDHLGLGLSKCYSIAARNHATISMETGQKGTTVLVAFTTGPKK